MTPSWKPLGPANSLAPLRTNLDTWLPPWTPETSLRCPLKSPGFRNVTNSLCVTPIWKALGQGSLLTPLRTNFDTWLPPGTPETSLRCPLKSHYFRNVSKASSVTTIWKPLGPANSLAPLRTNLETWVPPGTPETSLRCPQKSPDFRNVNNSLCVTPIWKVIGQGSSLTPLRNTFNTWLPPVTPETSFR